MVQLEEEGSGFTVQFSVGCWERPAKLADLAEDGGLMEWHLNPRLDTHLRASQTVQDASAGSSPQFSVTRKNG